jgi:hypothetical protein
MALFKHWITKMDGVHGDGKEIFSLTKETSVANAYSSSQTT